MDRVIYANNLALSRDFLIENLKDAIKQLNSEENEIFFCVGNVEIMVNFKDSNIMISA